MKGVYALYPDGASAQRAVDNLRREGVTDSEITVISSAPMEDFEFSHIGGKNRLWYVASLGGAIGLILSTSLVVFMERDWAVNTGGMPIVAWWPNLIVMFEMTMLGAIISTVVTLIITAGLGRRMPKLYDPEVTLGKILVGVAAPGDARMADVERALLAAPGAELKTV